MDPAELGGLYDLHAAGLVLYARQMLSTDSGGAEDIVQDVFVRLASQRQTPVNPRAWLIASVRHAALDRRKASQRRRKREMVSVMFQRPLRREAPAEALDVGELQTALLSLSAEEREAITLRIWNGATFEEISQVMEMPLSTVYLRYRSGLENLRVRWESPCRKK